MSLHYIDIDMISPHPDNPRKDLGDLTELADSIKLNGILQNLTIVASSDPSETYRAVIGHRRLAAAKLAGLTEVPCIISNMTPREQAATMLLENIQRNDLTVYEQAQGFQLMLNFGDTVNDIAKQTGFSETTVRKRVKLLELDQDKFQQSIPRGATLQDYAELSKIEDIDARNKVLDTIGTSEWNWKLRTALDDQERPKRKLDLLEFLKGWAKHVKNIPSTSSYETCFYGYKLGDFKKPKDAGKAEYYYVDNSNGITLYKKTAAAEKKQKSDAEKTFNEDLVKIKELTKLAFELRRDFILNFNVSKKHINSIMELAMNRLVRYGRLDPDILLELLEIEVPAEDESRDYLENQKIKRNLIFQEFKKQPERIMLITSWAALDDNEDYYSSHSFNCTINYDPNPILDAIYDVLITLGYEMSNEEKQLQDGTHELFTPKSGG